MSPLISQSPSHISSAMFAIGADAMRRIAQTAAPQPFTVNGQPTDKIGAIGALQIGAIVITQRGSAYRSTYRPDPDRPYVVRTVITGHETRHLSAPLAIACLATL